jgi:hypothetical protein
MAPLIASQHSYRAFFKHPRSKTTLSHLHSMHQLLPEQSRDVHQGEACSSHCTAAVWAQWLTDEVGAAARTTKLGEAESHAQPPPAARWWVAHNQHTMQMLSPQLVACWHGQLQVNLYES